MPTVLQRQGQVRREENEYKSGELTNQTESLELSLNAVGLIVKSVSRVKKYYYLPDQLLPMVW